jgi:plastocyanin
MKGSYSAARHICRLIVLFAVAGFSPSEFGREQKAVVLGKKTTATPIVILDQNAHVVPNDRPSATSQIFDVAVGPNGTFQFSPSTVNISAGDTVRWTWAMGFHSVTSGHPCIADLQFCSPNDMNCAAGSLSGPGTVYQHTFAQAGTYSYFCAAHCDYGMTGVVSVCSPPPANMVSWWGAEGNARDGLGNNDGTIQGGVTFAAGMVGQAFAFNGTDGEIVLPNSSSAPLLNFGHNDSFTLDAWVKPDPTVLGTQRAIVVLTYVCSPEVIELFVLADGRIEFDFRDSNAIDVITTSPSSILDSNWHHVTGVRDVTTNTATLYLDGTPVSSVADTTTGTFTRADGQNRIGSIAVACPTDRYFWKGQIDEVEIFNRALSASEVQAIVNAGSAGKCRALQLTAAASRKTHGAAGTFDINMPVTGQSGVECRTGGGTGDYTLVFTFNNALLSGSATVTGGTGTVSGSPTFSGRNMIVNVTGVTNVQILTVTLSNVTDVFNQIAGNASVNFGFLAGDTNANRAVNVADVAQTKSRVGQIVDATNFRSDVNANGSINAADVAIVKSDVGTALPP